MLIECLVLREGLTIVCVKDHNYEFMPIPGSEEGEMTSSVCNVANQDAIDYLLGNAEKKIRAHTNFRKYIPNKALTDLKARRAEKESKSGRLLGYSIEVLNVMGNDKGYMIKKQFPGHPTEFCGINAVWSGDVQKVFPFVKLSDADAFLRAFAYNQPLPVIDQSKPYKCLDCGEGFENPMDLAKHWGEKHVQDFEASKDDVDTMSAIEKANALINSAAASTPTEKSERYRNVPGK